MASINLIRGSDGTGNASVATVQNTRAPAATTIVVDTVDNIPATFMGSMGTPHTFVDPVTSETITVISEATAVDFTGSVDGSNLEIDSIAPGYTDAGSEVGDIVIIKPTTEWADNLADTLAVSHDDDGTLKDNSVTTANITNLNVTTAKLADDSVTSAKLDSDAIGHGFLEIGRTTLTSAGDTITVSSLPAKKYLRVIAFATGTNIRSNFTFNNDTSTNYANRTSTNGGADATSTADSAIFVGDVGGNAVRIYVVMDIVNTSANEKLISGLTNSKTATGDGTAPSKRETLATWDNTAAQISRIDWNQTSTGDFAIGSEVVVYGKD